MMTARQLNQHTAGDLFEPVEAARTIRESYVRYLKARYAPADDALRADLHDALDSGFRSTRGPFLQATPAYRKGMSVQDLVSEGLLHTRMQELDSDVLPYDRPLYKHQETALRKAVAGRNLIVATGTGSGKTECYLLPVLEHLLREAESGTLNSPGVRAMLLYPMNALANDQMGRIRALVRPFPEITFGRYTGATPYRRSEGEQQHRTEYGCDPDPGELVSRDQMRETPPHILLTNYAMLEYLLLRPDDTSFFDGPTGDHWRFVVLDEIHTYNGAKGAEIAMLLRRVRDRVNSSDRGRLRLFGTSATLGSGSDAPERVAEYATELFDEPVEYDSADSRCQDVVTPTVEEPAPPKDTWVAPEGAFAVFQQALSSGTADPAVLKLVPAHVLARGSATADAGIGSVVALADALRSERYVLRLAELLRSGPRDLAEPAASPTGLTEKVFDDSGRAAELSPLVAVCTNTYADVPPIVPARYHFMLRALEGAFLCKSPKHPVSEPRVRLDRHSTCPACERHGVVSQMFEFGVCHRCSAEFLIGDTAAQDDAGPLCVVQAPEHRRDLIYLLIGEQTELDDEDESAVVDDSDVTAVLDRRRLCTGCGSLSEALEQQCCCDDAVNASVVVTCAKPKRGQPLRRCPACSGRRNTSVVLRFVTGHDAPAAVVATSLYQSLPSEEPAQGRVPDVGEGRKLLSFSDSRQEAAFFASYLDRTYARAMQRRLIWKALDRNRADDLRFEDLVPLVRELAEDSLVINPDDSSNDKNSQVRRWLMAEILATDRRQSLDGVGLAEIAVVVPRGVTVPPIFRKLGFSDEEAFDIAAVLLESVRRQAAVHLPTGIDIEDPVFGPRNVVTAVRREHSDYSVMAWLPTRGMNTRLDYLTKLFEQRGIAEDSREVLAGIWHWFTDADKAWSGVLSPISARHHGTVFKLDPKRIRFVPASDSHSAFECSRCRQLAWRSVSGVCPAWRCDGTLEPVRVEGRPSDEHYRHRYLSLKPSGMRVEEHTGQLSTDRAKRFQQDFIAGTLNTLSCTTTFELGVDLGDVKAVLMRNVPPTPANYVQRAGRAGRRASTPALVVTFARRRAHDLYHFQKPMRLIEGNVDVPVVSLQNSLIVRRHIHAAAFAAFERMHADNGGEPHGNVGSFFNASDGGKATVDVFADWLQTCPPELAAAVARITPAKVAVELLGETGWQWVHDLVNVSNEPGREHFGWLRRAADEALSELAELDAEIDATMQRMQDLHAEGRTAQAQAQNNRLSGLYRTKSTLNSKRLIDFLASRVVLPKYGFPVDVVTLDVWQDSSKGSTDVELSRDLTLGITDYAPGSKVIANKAVWESVGLRILPGKALVDRRYSRCGCGRFRTRIDTGAEPVDHTGHCDACGSTVNEHKFVVPQFGFIGRQSDEPPGDTQPPKAGFSRVFFSDYDGDPPSVEEVPVSNTVVQVRFSRQGRITAINAGIADRGFRICMSCGRTEPTVAAGKAKVPAPHMRPGTSRECNGLLSVRHLGHSFLTDVVELDLMSAVPRSQQRDLSLDLDDTAHSAALSVLYAVLAATPALGIPSGDVNGVLGPANSAGRAPLIVFDTVPGGAGHVKRIREELPRLFRAALRIADECLCASETSCYGCLRTYRNQEDHYLLSRGEAASALKTLLGAAG